ncbi:hypothetical protein F5Y03DRAFT_398447 [Xylaria venustula]|nr:hypothetical protein F5Y03DRAFT_398447 [Xylaria venustula]
MSANPEGHLRGDIVDLGISTTAVSCHQVIASATLGRLLTCREIAVNNPFPLRYFRINPSMYILDNSLASGAFRHELPLGLATQIRTQENSDAQSSHHIQRRLFKNDSAPLSQVASAIPYLKGHVSYATDGSKNDPLLATRPEISRNRIIQTSHFENTPCSASYPTLQQSREQRLISPSPLFQAAYINIDGGLFLNMCVHHGVMDDRGLATATEIWAEFTRPWIEGKQISLRANRPPEPSERCSTTARLVKAAVLMSGYRYSNERTSEAL